MEGVLPSGRRLRDASDARDGHGRILSDAGCAGRIDVVVAIDAGSNKSFGSRGGDMKVIALWGDFREPHQLLRFLLWQ